jgi:hypothetical protein
LIILNESAIDVAETALLSEASLAEDWNRPEEDEAWSHSFAQIIRAVIRILETSLQL